MTSPAVSLCLKSTTFHLLSLCAYPLGSYSLGGTRPSGVDLHLSGEVPVYQKIPQPAG